MICDTVIDVYIWVTFYMCCPGFPFFFQYSSEILIKWYDEGILILVNIICKGILERIIMTLLLEYVLCE